MTEAASAADKAKWSSFRVRFMHHIFILFNGIGFVGMPTVVSGEQLVQEMEAKMETSARPSS